MDQKKSHPRGALFSGRSRGSLFKMCRKNFRFCSEPSKTHGEKNPHENERKKERPKRALFFRGAPGVALFPIYGNNNNNNNKERFRKKEKVGCMLYPSFLQTWLSYWQCAVLGELPRMPVKKWKLIKQCMSYLYTMFWWITKDEMGPLPATGRSVLSCDQKSAK